MTQYWPATFVQGLSESTKAVQDAFEQVSSIYLIMEGFVLGLALLIAFNTANINSDELAACPSKTRYVITYT